MLIETEDRIFHLGMMVQAQVRERNLDTDEVELVEITLSDGDTITRYNHEAKRLWTLLRNVGEQCLFDAATGKGTADGLTARRKIAGAALQQARQSRVQLSEALDAMRAVQRQHDQHLAMMLALSKSGDSLQAKLEKAEAERERWCAEAHGWKMRATLPEKDHPRSHQPATTNNGGNHCE